MLRRLGIRGKVLAALSVPVLVLFLLAGLVSLDSIQQAQTARTVTSLLSALQESREVVTAVQAERRAALPYVSGNRSAAAEKDSSREITADAIAQFEASIAKVDLNQLDPAVTAAVRDLRSTVDGLDGVRGRVDAQNVSMASILNNYTRVIENLVAFPRQVADALDDRRLAAILSGSAMVTGLAEDYNEEQALGAQMLAGARDSEEISRLGTLFPATDVAHRQADVAVRALRIGPTTVVPPLGASWDGSQSYASYRTLIATGEPLNFAFVTEADWTNAASEEIAAFDPVQRELRQAAASRAQAVASSAVRNSALTIGGSLAAVILSIVAALAIARQIINPLRRLTEAAGTVRDELPRLVDQVAVPGQGPDLRLTQIPVVGRDEVSQLAAAFNEVNSTTIHVAQEQAALRGSIAEMFVNVARRDQVLLNRQLSFIDALERSEEDPKTLADLFRLDHLATRMRRNAESLLVLAGIDTGRRLREALPLSDVIRTASSEIEHYERIQLDLPVDPMMLGHTALPAAHMLAELLENATVFSEPGTPVQVSTGIDETHVLITVLDQGLGMTQVELDEANTRMKAVSAGDVLGSQRLGMFVVGRIAARLGAEAELTVGPDGTGTLAVIRMPLVLFVDPSRIPLTQPMHAAAATVETFVLPEQAAEALHDSAHAAVPASVGDVAPGALGSVENPAEAVDLEALTDGTTGLGLPRRRSRVADVESPAPSLRHREEDDAAAAPSIPLAPRADALAGAAGAADGEAWTPPVVQTSTPLVSRRSQPAEEPAAALPTRRAPEPTAPAEPSGFGQRITEAGSSLPTRQPAGTALPTRQPAAVPPPVAPAQASAAPTSSPENRSAIFSGFRSRRAELAAAAIHVESGDHPTETTISVDGPDGAERLAAAAAGAAAFFGRGTTPAGAPAEEQPETEPETPAMVIPQLVEDDEYGDPSFSYPSVEPAATTDADEYGRAGEYGRADEYAPTGEYAAPTGYAAPADELSGPRHAHAVEESADVSWPPAPVGAAPVAPVASEEPAWLAEPVGSTEAVEPDEPAWFAEPTQPAAAAQPTWSPDPVQPTEQPVDSAETAPYAAPYTEPAAYAQPAAYAEPAAYAATGPDIEPLPVASAPAEPASFAETVAPAPAVMPEQAAPEQAAPAFADLVNGPSRRDARPAKRRRWFGRKQAEVEPVAAPVAEPPAAFVPPTGFGVVTPFRQSAWGPTETGAHAEPTPEPVAPAAPQPTAFAAAGIQTPVFEPQDWTQPASAAAHAPVVQPDPVVQAQSAWRAEAPAEGWAPEPAPAAPVAEPVAGLPARGSVFTPAPVAPDAPVPGSSFGAEWSLPKPAAPVPQAPAAPVAHTPEPAVDVPSPHSPFSARTFTPQTGGGAFDDEVTNMLAQRADLAQQALAELSQLSSYRPKAAPSGGESTLVRRTPGTIPAAPAIETRPAGQRTERDANQVRSLLSSFQSGTSRGRQVADPTSSTAGTAGGTNHQSPGENGASHAGHQNGPDGDHGDPVTTPGTDLPQRSTSW